MFKKHKQLIIGFLLGALLFSIVPVGATVQGYLLKKSSAKLMVDGKEFANKELPVLNYQGYNYIPAAIFRETCNTIGVGFEWAGVKNEIQINTGKSKTLQPVKESIQPIEERKGESMVNIEKDGYRLVVVDGVEYIAPREIHEYLIDNNLDYRIEYNQEAKSLQIFKINDKEDFSKDTVLLDNIPTPMVIDGRNYVNYNYFLETILPVIK